MTERETAHSKSTETRNGRYEFRVWGEHADAGDRLSELADLVVAEDVDDCYLLVPDPSYNAKIRRRRLKVKRLVEERFGFQRWSTQWHRVADNAPEPFGSLLTELDRRPVRRDNFGLASAIASIEQRRFRPVFVTKHRRRYRSGSVRAEAVDLEIGGRSGPVCTVAIEGRDLGELIRLRSSLGLDLAHNVALHVALDPRFGF